MTRWFVWALWLTALAAPPGFAADSSEARLRTALPFHGEPLDDASFGPDAEASVGLYVGKGTWDAGKEHLKMFLSERGYTYRSLTAKDILDGVLIRSGVRLLIMPGGESWEYLKELGAAGADLIRGFVAQGGGYLGICAGAFYATSHREGGYATGPYGIGLLEGTAYDGTALKTPPFIEGMMDLNFPQTALLQGLQAQFRIVMFGGPSFRYAKDEAQKKEISVLARFQKIDEPGMITFHFGRGRVFLSGPHLEIEEDRTNWGLDFFDPDSEWPILDRVMPFLSRG